MIQNGILFFFKTDNLHDKQNFVQNFPDDFLYDQTFVSKDAEFGYMNQLEQLEDQILSNAHPSSENSIISLRK